ncbi:MAG: pseudoazurin [Marinovum sp.]|nr:pseudoazurin [Marinovum sp.]
MTSKLNRREVIIAGAAAALAGPALAGGHATAEVQMLNKHPDNSKLRQVFYPRITVIEAGDAVKWVATDRGHNSASSKDMIVDGSEAWKGKINDEIEVKFDTPGFYGYQCTPHVSSGMVGLVIVKGEGMMDNLEAIKGVRQRGKAKKTWEEIFAEVDKMDLASA